MANFFDASRAPVASQRSVLSVKYTSSRHNLLFVVAFSLINLVLLLTNSGTYFLFSASLPYIIADWGMFLCGKYPAEIYAEYYPEMTTFLDSSVLVVLVAIAVIIIALYLLCWIMSKKHGAGWLIAALVFFCLDTAAMFLLPIDVSFLLDIAFHGWVIYSLAVGIVANSKLKKLPEEDPAAEVQIPFVEIPVVEDPITDATAASATQDEPQEPATSDEENKAK